MRAVLSLRHSQKHSRSVHAACAPPVTRSSALQGGCLWARWSSQHGPPPWSSKSRGRTSDDGSQTPETPHNKCAYCRAAMRHICEELAATIFLNFWYEARPCKPCLPMEGMAIEKGWPLLHTINWMHGLTSNYPAFGDTSRLSDGLTKGMPVFW